MIEVRSLTASSGRGYLPHLAEVLLDCVRGGASVGFMASLTIAEAEAFFDRCLREAETGQRILLAAFLDTKLVGTIQIVTATPPNQPHRADLAKLLVHRAVRRMGIASLLLERAEQASLGAGKSLLVLDTVTGDSAERLYQRLGWTRAGVIPRYALYPDGRWCDTTIFWKQLDGAALIRPHD